MRQLARSLVVLLLVAVAVLDFCVAAKEAAPVDCVVSNWTAVGQCSVSPPHVRKWTRTVLTKPVNKGKPCPSLSKRVTCKPVNCKMSKWTKWSTCSKRGEKTRTRSVVKTAKYGGRVCPSRTDKVRCKPSPVDCTLATNWSPWGPCESNAQAFFVTNRTRDVATNASNGGSCPAADDPRRLEIKPCHLNCEKQDTVCAQAMSKFEEPIEKAMYMGRYIVVNGVVDHQWQCAAACVALSSCRAYSYQSTVMCLVSDGDVQEEISEFGSDSLVVSAKLRWDEIPPLPSV